MIWIFFPLLLFAGIIEQNISSIYKKTYPSIDIKKIILKNYKNQPIKSIDLSTINTKRNAGTIKVNNSYIFFKIDALIKVLKTTQSIKKNQLLDTTNTKLDLIKFKNFYSYPLTNYTNKVAKMYIPKNKIVYEYMITTPNLVLRGETIDIIANSGGIEITFKATAMQNGKIGDKIKVKKDKQIFFVTIDKNGNGQL